MEQIVFKNKGVIDLRAIKTFGVSSKDGPNPIGFFGTGLKYAIAILLRAGCEIEIYAGLDKIAFSVIETTIRNDSFQLIKMNDEELAFTTELGKKWQIWQAFRELYCNCLDEGGEISSGAAPEPQADQTVVMVRGALFAEQYRNRDAIFLATQPFMQAAAVDIHNGASKHLFYRKVRVHDLPRTSLYTYNIRDMLDLTEDRTVKHEWQATTFVTNAVCQSEDPGFIEDCVTAKPDFFEHHLNYSSYSVKPSDVFMKVCRALKKERPADLNLGATALVSRHTEREYLNEGAIKLSEIEQKQLDRAIEYCNKLDFNVEEYPINVMRYLGEGVQAMAIRIPTPQILLSQRLFMTGSQHVARALIEEWIHLKYDFNDCSREMQNYLFEQIMHFGSIAIGEAL